MGYALIWVEGLAVGLTALALATAWAVRGSIARWLAVVIVEVLFLAPALYFTYLVTSVLVHHPHHPIRTTHLPYLVSWMGAFLAGSVFVVWHGTRRPAPGLGREAAAWPIRRLGLWFGGAVLVFAMTFWNMDLATRADLAIGRQEAGAFLLSLYPSPASEGENAAPPYTRLVKELTEPIKEPWNAAARNGLDAELPAKWTDAYPADLVKRHEAQLALMRKAAAMPRCYFDYQPGPLDVVMRSAPFAPSWPGRGATLLAVNARVEATRGNLTQAFDDVSAILGFARHVTDYHAVMFVEFMAWRTLEEVLRLAPADKGPLPALTIPELSALARLVRREQALLGIVLSAAASQPSLLSEEWKNRHGPWTPFVVEVVLAPLGRFSVIPDELVAMRRLFDEYRKSPRSARDETPKDWADIHRSVEHDPTSLYGAVYIKPKHQVLLREGAALATLRQTARTALAAAAYQRKHGRYPERLEQLVPEFLPGVPTDPRDGQVLRFRRTADALIFYAPQDAERMDSEKAEEYRHRWVLPVFRLFPRAVK